MNLQVIENDILIAEAEIPINVNPETLTVEETMKLSKALEAMEGKFMTKVVLIPTEPISTSLGTTLDDKYIKNYIIHVQSTI